MFLQLDGDYEAREALAIQDSAPPERRVSSADGERGAAAGGATAAQQPCRRSVARLQAIGAGRCLALTRRPRQLPPPAPRMAPSAPQRRARGAAPHSGPRPWSSVLPTVDGVLGRSNKSGAHPLFLRCHERVL